MPNVIMNDTNLNMFHSFGNDQNRLQIYVWLYVWINFFKEFIINQVKYYQNSEEG